jgi:two-component system, chemotaxis family, protein-glutamate methylesterase/glutaminase
MLVDERQMSIAVTAPLVGSARDRESIRVMVVDDAVVVRAMITRWVDAELDMQIVASLRGAPEAIEQVERKNPDVVILDITMPDMDGITALPRLLEKKRNLVVLMVSTLTRRNAEISVQALSLGAADYIPKPESDREFMSSDSFRRELIDKIRVLGSRRKFGHGGCNTISAAESNAFQRDIELDSHAHLDVPSIAASAPEPGAIVLRPFPPMTPRVLLIGSSTGGPQALNAILGTIGKVIDNAPVLITQHMPPTFTTILAEHLARTSGRPAAEAKDGERIRAGQIYVAPGGLHMHVARCDGEPVIALDDGPPVHFCKPAVDPLFASAAAVWGSWNLALILTGMGCDGARGAAQVVAAGGGVIAQDEASSVVWGMPGKVAQAGLASAVLPLDQIAPKIVRLFCGGRP